LYSFLRWARGEILKDEIKEKPQVREHDRGDDEGVKRRRLGDRNGDESKSRRRESKGEIIETMKTAKKLSDRFEARGDLKNM